MRALSVIIPTRNERENVPRLLGDLRAARAHAAEMAEVFGLSYAEVPGSLEYVRRLVHGPWDTEDFVIVQPGSPISPTPFMSLHTIALP